MNTNKEKNKSESDTESTEEKYPEMKPENEFSLDKFPVDKKIQEVLEISLSDSTIRLLSNDINRYKTVKEIFLEEEIKRSREEIKNHRQEKPGKNEIEKIEVTDSNLHSSETHTEKTDKEKMQNDKQKKIERDSRNRNQMF